MNTIVQRFVQGPHGAKQVATQLSQVLGYFTALVNRDTNGGYSKIMQAGDAGPGSTITPTQLQTFMAIGNFMAQLAACTTQAGLATIMSNVQTALNPSLSPTATTPTTLGAMVDQIALG